jgi:hypothetical protein
MFSTAIAALSTAFSFVNIASYAPRRSPLIKAGTALHGTGTNGNGSPFRAKDGVFMAIVCAGDGVDIDC